MSEDKQLEVAVKSALEEGGAFDDVRLSRVLCAARREACHRRLRRLFVRWGGTSLLAASLAFVLAVRNLAVDESTCAADGVENAIGLLCELEGISFEPNAKASPGELLQAWQEAPCSDLF